MSGAIKPALLTMERQKPWLGARARRAVQALERRSIAKRANKKASILRDFSANCIGAPTSNRPLNDDVDDT